jgi:hypothetical protein
MRQNLKPSRFPPTGRGILKLFLSRVKDVLEYENPLYIMRT